RLQEASRALTRAMPDAAGIKLEQTYPAPVEDVWELWTTKAGIESWWAPDGFTVEVSKLELEPGGELLYAMTATGPEQIEFMSAAGLPLTNEARKTFTEVIRGRAPRVLVARRFRPGGEAVRAPHRGLLPAGERGRADGHDDRADARRRVDAAPRRRAGQRARQPREAPRGASGLSPAA